MSYFKFSSTYGVISVSIGVVVIHLCLFQKVTILESKEKATMVVMQEKSKYIPIFEFKPTNQNRQKINLLKTA